MDFIENKNFPCERALYAVNGVTLKNCSFDGEEDGESALKEAKNIRLYGCYMNLRYPLWHDDGVEIENTVMTDKCRAALWYSNGVMVGNSSLGGIKALRECQDVNIENSKIVSAEFGWRCRGVALKNSAAESEYFFFETRDLTLSEVKFKGKYSFQYTENVVAENCVLDTKDAFWHAKNVTVKNSVVKGEYLAWYSEDLTFINCKISGTQPLCYCKNLKLIDCEMTDTDLSFEYSDVNADIKGEIVSVKYPRSGRIVADGYGEIILTDDSVYACDCKIETRK